MPRCGTSDTRKDLEYRGLAGSIVADQPENLAGFDVEADIVKGPEMGLASPPLL